MTLAPPNLLLSLRQRTRRVHEDLERRLPLLSPGLTLDGYRDVLVRFARVQPPLERAIEAVLTANDQEAMIALDVPARRKEPALRDDLARLGVAMPSPACCEVAIDSVPTAVGALYVTEGATLGGTVIATHLRGHFGTDVPLAFFESYGADVAARWATFRRASRALIGSEEEVAEAADAADAVFAWFGRTLAP